MFDNVYVVENFKDRNRLRGKNISLKYFFHTDKYSKSYIMKAYKNSMLFYFF